MTSCYRTSSIVIEGTVGDIESLPYIESVGQLKWELGSRALVIHLTLVPYLAATGELKTKPTQHSVKMLLEAGVQPDVLVLRTEHNIELAVRQKVALFCNVDIESVIESVNVPTIYDVPLKMLDEKLDDFFFLLEQKHFVLFQLRLSGSAFKGSEVA